MATLRLVLIFALPLVLGAGASCASRTASAYGWTTTPAPPAGPAVVLVETWGGWGSAVPLPDGTYLTARHVLSHMPRKIAGRPVRRIDILAVPGRDRGAWMPVGASDLTRFRADVHPEGSDTILGDAFLHEGQRVYAAGFLREPERAAAGDDPYVLRIVPARVIERPWWEEVNSQELIYLALPRGVRAKGMSGGPIAVWNDRAGRTEVVGIMLGRVGLRVLGITFDEVHVAVRCPTLDPARLGNAVPVD